MSRARPAVHEAVGLSLSMGVVALAILACGDPAWSMTGTVVDSAGAPVPGAKIVVTCPGRSGPVDTQLTGPKGEVNGGGIPAAPPTCTAEISAAGHATKTVPVTDFCYRSTTAGNYGSPCAAGSGKVVLP
jgi:hypothetical protein